MSSWWMVAAFSAEPLFRDIVVVGGGCYGSFYAGQLTAARARDAITYRRVIVVDRNPRCAVAAMVPDDLRQLQADVGQRSAQLVRRDHQEVVAQ